MQLCHDCRSPVGVPESTPQLFGNSWKTLSACSPLVAGSPLDPCDVHLQAGEVRGEGGGSGVRWDWFERGEMGTLGLRRLVGLGRSDKKRWSCREGTVVPFW